MKRKTALCQRAEEEEVEEKEKEKENGLLRFIIFFSR